MVFNGVGDVADGDRAGFGKFLAVDGDLGGDGGSTCPFCIKVAGSASVGTGIAGTNRYNIPVVCGPGNIFSERTGNSRTLDGARASTAAEGHGQGSRGYGEAVGGDGYPTSGGFFGAVCVGDSGGDIGCTSF